MAKRLIIIGGVAGGATAAARARRLDENATIILIERGNDVSFANCGLPYHIGGEIPARKSLLVQTKEGLRDRFRLDVRTNTEALKIDRQKKSVTIKDLNSGKETCESYDALILSPGASPIVPPIPGSDHPAIFTLRDMRDMDQIKSKVDKTKGAALVIGGGFIGLEMAENLSRKGFKVSIIDLAPQVMPPLDMEMAAPLQTELEKNGITLHLENTVVKFDDLHGKVQAHLKTGEVIEADIIIMAIGVRPESKLAKACDLAISKSGAIVVDETMQTSDPDIYAVGDAVQVKHTVLGINTTIPLAGPANRQARIAADNIFGRHSIYSGSQGTSVVRVFRLTAAMTGASEKALKQVQIPYKKIFVSRTQHVGYFPGAEQMTIKLLFAPDNGRILGAQIVGDGS